MSLRWLLVPLALLLSCANVAAGPTEATAGEQLPVSVHTRRGVTLLVYAEVARTDAERRQGLMHRRQLGPDDGMLFVFEADARHSFWMRNTLIPLDMIFIQSDGTIAGIVKEAEPQTDTPRGIASPTRYVLEVNGGWCDLHDIKPGDRVDVGAAFRR